MNNEGRGARIRRFLATRGPYPMPWLGGTARRAPPPVIAADGRFPNEWKLPPGTAIGMSIPLFPDEERRSLASQSAVDPIVQPAPGELVASPAVPPLELTETASMKISPGLLENMFTGWKTDFAKGQQEAPSEYQRLAMMTKSSTAREVYTWFGQFPGLREWIGERRVKQLQAYNYTLENRKFESTIIVERTAIEDDTAGVYGPMFRELGRAAGAEPDILTFMLLSQGFTTACYDRQNFFDTIHPLPTPGAPGGQQLVSNYQPGASPAWYLFDTTRAIKPMLFQDRIMPMLQRADSDGDPNVFWKDQYIYGVRARMAVGFGLWQLAAASKQPLNAANFEIVRNGMIALTGDDGRPLGIKPNLMVVPATMEGAARALLNKTNLAGGETNIWAGSVDLISTPWLPSV